MRSFLRGNTPLGEAVAQTCTTEERVCYKLRTVAARGPHSHGCQSDKQELGTYTELEQGVRKGTTSSQDAPKKPHAETATELDALLPSILDKAFKGDL